MISENVRFADWCGRLSVRVSTGYTMSRNEDMCKNFSWHSEVGRTGSGVGVRLKVGDKY